MKNAALNGIQTHDLCDAIAVLYTVLAVLLRALQFGFTCKTIRLLQFQNVTCT